MSSLVLGIRYLTGYAVATDPADRESAEWPPHPGRVFMALAAAFFETGEDPVERDALEWLETLSAPLLHVPATDPRTVVTHYVPVNDSAGPSKAPLQSAPDFTRDRAGRAFPRVRLHDEQAFLEWDVEPAAGHRAALQALCAKVTRIGHSSSLVQMWVADRVAPDLQAWTPDPEAGEEGAGLRITGAGTLEYLREEYNGEAVERFAQLSDAITAAKGREQKALKEEYERTFGVSWRRSASPPESRRPVLGLWQSYARRRPVTGPLPASVFDPAIQVLRLEPKDARFRGLELVTAPYVVDVLRKALQARVDQDLGLERLPEVLSGHHRDGTPSERPHAAFLPLGFVGHEHADGSLKGIGVALPREEYWPEREAEYRTVITLLARTDKLTLGRLGVWNLIPELGEIPAATLRPEVWTASSRGAEVWASVTPVVFDTHPKAKDRTAYREEVARMVLAACTRIGLPDPVHVDLDGVSWHRGAPPAREVPRLRRKDGSERRHMHVYLDFGRPVAGPVVLGAGRYRGYGVCRPLPRKRAGAS